MSKKYTLVFGVFVLALSLVMALNYKRYNMNKTLKILYPLNVLKSEAQLLDPNNTDTIWEYYLLENLSCGLVRDSKDSPTNYEGCIADKYYLENTDTWVFHIRNISWSDGQIVTESQILKWISSLQIIDKRHIQFLKSATSVVYDVHSRILKIKFPFSVDETILHELSLADAGLFPDNYKVNGWAKTVGPYFVDKWSSKENILSLKANKYSPLFNLDSPKSVDLFRLLDPAKRETLFKDLKVDIVPATAISNPNNIEILKKNSSQLYEAYPTAIIYFKINHTNEIAKSIDNRIMFSNIINEIRPRLSKLTERMLSLESEQQMIPEGFSGRINSHQEKVLKNTIKIRELKISLPTVFKDMVEFTTELKTIFLSKMINVQIIFDDSGKAGEDIFALMTLFIGNQLDSSGSWAFLANPNNGVFSDWYSVYKTEYENVYDTNNMLNKDENLIKLHKKILESYIAVPFMIGKQKYFLSDQINVSRWNRFDSRLRIYEIRWN